jgi:phosphoribulokinase
MSRSNTIVCPGGKMDLAMQLVFTPMIWRLLERRKEALARSGEISSWRNSLNASVQPLLT